MALDLAPRRAFPELLDVLRLMCCHGDERLAPVRQRLDRPSTTAPLHQFPISPGERAVLERKALGRTDAHRDEVAGAGRGVRDRGDAAVGTASPRRARVLDVDADAASIDLGERKADELRDVLVGVAGRVLDDKSAPHHERYGKTSWTMRRRPGRPIEMRSDLPSQVTSVSTTISATKAIVRRRGTGRSYAAWPVAAGGSRSALRPYGDRVELAPHSPLPVADDGNLRQAAGRRGQVVAAAAPTVAAAVSISAATSAGCETIATWLEVSSVVVAPMRPANCRWASGGMTSSFSATRYQVGCDFHAGAPSHR